MVIRKTELLGLTKRKVKNPSAREIEHDKAVRFAWEAEEVHGRDIFGHTDSDRGPPAGPNDRPCNAAAPYNEATKCWDTCMLIEGHKGLHETRGLGPAVKS